MNKNNHLWQTKLLIDTDEISHRTQTQFLTWKPQGAMNKNNHCKKIPLLTKMYRCNWWFMPSTRIHSRFHTQLITWPRYNWSFDWNTFLHKTRVKEQDWWLWHTAHKKMIRFLPCIMLANSTIKCLRINNFMLAISLNIFIEYTQIRNWTTCNQVQSSCKIKKTFPWTSCFSYISQNTFQTYYNATSPI